MSTWPVLRLAEDQYAYGAGALTVRIERVERDRPVRYAGDEWYRVHGVRIGHGGRDMGPVEILVRRRLLDRRVPPGRRPA